MLKIWRFAMSISFYCFISAFNSSEIASISNFFNNLGFIYLASYYISFRQTVSSSYSSNPFSSVHWSKSICTILVLEAKFLAIVLLPEAFGPTTK